MDGRQRYCIILAGFIVLVTLWWHYKIQDQSVTQSVSSSNVSYSVKQDSRTLMVPTEKTPTLLLEADAAEQDTAGQTNKSCGAVDVRKFGFYSQSNEDIAVYEKFFRDGNGPTLCHGTFVEIGALDGVLFSNSLFFEKHLHWRGVLIEGNPQLIDLLREHRPLAKNFGLCVCRPPQEEVIFVMNDNTAVGGVLDSMSSKHYQAYFGPGSRQATVPCKPMGAILQEAKLTSVDVFIIDVEGAENVVLQTMDWTIPVHVIVIEMGGHSEERDQLNRKFLERLGFVNTLPQWDIKSYCTEGGDCAGNEVYVNPDYPELPGPLKQ